MRILCYVAATVCILSSLSIIGADTFEQAIRPALIFALGVFWISIGRTF